MPIIYTDLITTPRTTLRIVDKSAIPDLLEMNGDPTVTRFLPYKNWETIDDGYAWLDRMIGICASGDALQLVIHEKESNKAIGTCLLFRHDSASSRAEIGYALGKKHWGKGLMHEALSALIDHAFTHCSLRRIEAEVNPQNIASNKTLLRLGFTHEGLLRQRWVDKTEQPYSSNIYGLLRDEWPLLIKAEC